MHLDGVEICILFILEFVVEIVFEVYFLPMLLCLMFLYSYNFGLGVGNCWHLGYVISVGVAQVCAMVILVMSFILIFLKSLHIEP